MSCVTRLRLWQIFVQNLGLSSEKLYWSDTAIPRNWTFLLEMLVVLHLFKGFGRRNLLERHLRLRPDWRWLTDYGK